MIHYDYGQCRIKLINGLGRVRREPRYRLFLPLVTAYTQNLMMHFPSKPVMRRYAATDVASFSLQNQNSVL